MAGGKRKQPRARATDASAPTQAGDVSSQGSASEAPSSAPSSPSGLSTVDRELSTSDRDWPALPTHLAVAGVLLLLFFVRLGSYGLWDPWESHYAEVAREILERRDPIRLHWAREWFWSKPVLAFWLMAIGLKLGNVGTATDPAELVRSFRPEWLLRTPFALVGAAGIFCLYLALTRRLGRRAAALGAVCAASAAQVLFIARQAITDMLFVGLASLAIAAYVKSLDCGDDDPAPTIRLLRGKKPLSIRLTDLAFWAVALAVVPQIVMLVGWLYGKGPGAPRDPLGAGGWPHALPFVAALIALRVAVVRYLDRARDGWLLLAYLAAGLAVLGKGIPGLVLPLAVLVIAGALGGEIKRELRPRMLAVHAVGLGVTLAVAVPWFWAMNLSFPRAFVKEFFGQHHWRRLAVGVHGDTGGLEYYVPWLAYGLFPWTGLAVVGLLSARGWLWRRAEDTDGGEPLERQRARLLLASWTVVALAIFTVTKTKFHHYILPATLPMAFLAGVALDDAIRGRLRTGAFCLALLVFAIVAMDLHTNPTRLVWLFVYNYKRPWPAELDYKKHLLVLSLLYVLPLAALMATSLLRRETRLLHTAALGTVAAALVIALFLGQVYQVEAAQHWTQKSLMARYFAERQPDPTSGGKPEVLVAWQMNWRGETFYTKAKEVPFVALNNHAINRWLKRQPAGKRIFIVFEKARLGRLRKLLGPGPSARLELLTGRENNKFYLARTVLGPEEKKPDPPTP